MDVLAEELVYARGEPLGLLLGNEGSRVRHELEATLRQESGEAASVVAGEDPVPVRPQAAESLGRLDRRWAFVRDGVVRSGFPWLTIRERSDMAHYRPAFLEPGRVAVGDQVVVDD